MKPSEVPPPKTYSLCVKIVCELLAEVISTRKVKSLSQLLAILDGRPEWESVKNALDFDYNARLLSSESLVVENARAMHQCGFIRRGDGGVLEWVDTGDFETFLAARFLVYDGEP